MLRIPSIIRDRVSVYFITCLVNICQPTIIVHKPVWVHRHKLEILFELLVYKHIGTRVLVFPCGIAFS